MAKEVTLDMLKKNRLRLQFNLEAIYKKYENIDDSEDIEIDPCTGEMFVPVNMEKKVAQKKKERFYAVNENFGLSALSAPFNNAETLENQPQLMKKCQKRDKDFGRVLELTPYAEPTPEKKNAKVVIREEEQKYTCTGISVEELERRLREDGVSGDIFERNEAGGEASVTFKKQTMVVKDVDEKAERQLGPSQAILDAVERGFAEAAAECPLKELQNSNFHLSGRPHSRAKNGYEADQDSASDCTSVKSGPVMRSPWCQIKEEPLPMIGEADEEVDCAADLPEEKPLKKETDVAVKEEKAEGGEGKEEDQLKKPHAVVYLSSDDEVPKAETGPVYSIFSRKRRASGKIFTFKTKKSRDSDWDSVELLELPRSEPGDAPLQPPLDDAEKEWLWNESAGNVVDSFRSEKCSTVVGLGLDEASRICAKSPKKVMLELWAEDASIRNQQDIGSDYVMKEEERVWRNARSRNERLATGYEA